tara:strand:- start:109 stop:273 length:165 start_codon:yes stop_codon:yes gene_type:complete
MPYNRNNPLWMWEGIGKVSPHEANYDTPPKQSQNNKQQLIDKDGNIIPLGDENE